MPTFTLESGLDTVLGAKAAAALKRAFLMITVGDLLAHYPRRYAKIDNALPRATQSHLSPLAYLKEHHGSRTHQHHWQHA